MRLLKDIKVIEIGAFITAPYAAMLLAELGADVVKVERPLHPDPFRGGLGPEDAPYFVAFNRNKRSLAIDYDKPEGLEALYDLVRAADVFIINVRPGTEKKIGLDPETLRAINPRLIYCSITGFGSTGPYAGRPAFDNVGQALSGLLARFHRGSDPRVAGPAMSDTVTGLFAALGVVCALFERERCGDARFVEVNMLEASLNFAIDPVAHFLVHGQEQPFFLRGASSQSYVLTCRDGRRIGIHMSSPDKFWLALAKATGRHDLLSRFPSREDKIAGYDTIASELADVFAAKDRDEWVTLLEANDVPFAPELSPDELVNDPQVKHLGIFGNAKPGEGGSRKGINRALRFDGDNRSIHAPPPEVGEHNEEILAQWGVPEERIALLRDSGCLGGRNRKTSGPE